MADSRRACLGALTRIAELLFGRGWWSDGRQDGLRGLVEWEEELDDLLYDVHWQVPPAIVPLRTGGIDPSLVRASIRVAFPQIPVAQAPGNED